MKIIEAEAGNLVQRLTLLLEAGAMFSAANKASIQKCIDTLQSIIDGAVATAPAASQPTKMAASRRAPNRPGNHLLSEAELSFDDREEELRGALVTLLGNPNWLDLEDVYDTYAVYKIGDQPDVNEKTYRIPYSILDGKVTLGKPFEVERVVTYVPVGAQAESASIELSGDVIPLVESIELREFVPLVGVG
jgi:hypothetical protein